MTYNWYANSVITVVTNTFVYISTNTWKIANTYTADNYKAMGQTYPNFSSTTDAKNIIPIYLKNSFLPYAKSGDYVLIQYAVYSSSTKSTSQYVLPYTYNGTIWSAVNSVNPATIVVNYDGTIWKFPPQVKVEFFNDAAPANAISYTVTNADYTLVGNKYADFDRRPGQTEGDDNVFLGKIATILKTRLAASIAIGQIYAVTYADYSGSNPPPNKTVYVKVIPL